MLLIEDHRRKCRQGIDPKPELQVGKNNAFEGAVMEIGSDELH